MSAPSAKPAANEEVPDWVGAYMSTCIACAQTDNHPMLITGDLDKPPIHWHHDCYVIAKQPGWEDIAALIAGANGATGHALRLHLHPDPTTAPQEA